MVVRLASGGLAAKLGVAYALHSAMILPRRAIAVLLACLLVAGAAAGQSPPPPFADDDRAARVAERYEAMLAANPAEGVALDRLWNMYAERSATAALIDRYRRATDGGDKPADALVYGHLLKRAGRLDEAAGSYARAARLDPTSALPLVSQADLFVVRGQPADAAALFEQALDKASPADRRRAEWLLKLGDAWIAAGQPLKAGDAWERLSAANPSDLALHKQLAVNYEEHGLPERALGHYEYIDQHGDPAARAAALRELARLHEAHGDFDVARDALERGLALTARDNWLYTDLQTRLIRLYQREAKTSELEARWRAAVEQTPRDLGNYQRLVALAEAQGDPANARVWLEKALALAPRDRDNTLKLARLLADLGEGKRAAALYDNLLKTQPANLEWILARADLDVQANQNADAVSRVEARVAQNPADESASVPALQFFISRHLDDAAERLLSAAVKRQPAATEPALALAKFYFAHGRLPNAQAVLGRLTGQPGAPDARAARWAAAADCCKEGGETEEALRDWQQVENLQPGSASAAVAVAELRLLRGDMVGGIEQLERAIAAAPAGLEREETDHKLFQVLLDHSPAGETTVVAPGRWRSGVLFDASGTPLAAGSIAASATTTKPAAKEPDQPLLRYVDGLEKTARETKSAAAYLRLARWLTWSRRPHDAASAADAALALDPSSLAAREILADAAVAQHNHGAAIRRLNEIAALDPKRWLETTKRIADLMLEDGAFDGAMVLLDRRVQEEPGSAEAFTDLALAQQRADRWFDALATWEQAYALPRLSPAQRSNLRQPLIACHEHLGQFQRAAELLESAVEAQDDLASRQDLFRELATFCQTHGLTVWLTDLYREKLVRQPQDYFVMTADAALQKAAGDPRSAYALLERAYYSAPEPAAALRTLISEAESLGEADGALTHQRRLVGLPGQSNAENLEKLASLEEAAFDDEAAARVWEQIVTRFPRDTAALGAAAEYYTRARRTGRAREVLTAAVTLDPADFRRQSALAQLDLQAGDQAGAQRCLETILDRTQAESTGDALVLPRELDPSTEPSELMASAVKGSDRALPGAADPAATVNDERGVRLQAVGQLSRLLFAEGGSPNGEERRRWIGRWRAAVAAGLRSEPLTAFFEADQADEVAGLTASWLDNPGPLEVERAEKIFLLACLRTKRYPALARWVWNDQPEARGERSAQLSETLQYFLSTGGRPAPELCAQVFPERTVPRAYLLQSASAVFAEKRWYLQAVELGERALAMPGGNLAADAFQLAQWDLDIDRPEAARAVLRRAVDVAEGASYDPATGDAVFADLRAYYFLLPQSERGGFAEDYLRRMRARGGNGVHAALASALLHGLQGDEETACRELDRIVDFGLLDASQSGESADVRRWNYLFTCGTQLQAWHLDRMAAYVWRRGLSGASAFDKNDLVLKRLLGEIRLHQLVAEVTTAADPQEARERVTEYLRENPPVVSMASAASVLMNAGQYPAAVQIYEHLHRLVPTDPEYPRARLLAEEASGDPAAVDAGLGDVLDGDALSGPFANPTELLIKRARLSETIGAKDRAVGLLLKARREAPNSLPILWTLARTLEQQKRLDDAAAIWREAAGHDSGPTSLDALAMLEAQRGHGEEAYALAQEEKEPSSEMEQAGWLLQRVRLYLAAGHVAGAVDLVRQQVLAGKQAGVPEAAAALARQGQAAAARDLLAEAGRLARTPLARYQTQAELLEETSAKRDEPVGDFLREMRRLEQFARAAPGQQDRYLEERYALAVRRGATDWLEGELKREWDDSHGEVAAGSQLAKLYLETKRWEGLRQLATQFDARPNLPEQTLFSLETLLGTAGHADWSLSIGDRLCRRFPQNVEYAAGYARALWQAGRRDDALRVLDRIDNLGIFRDDFTGQTAQVRLEFGDRAGAIASLERATALDPLATRSAALYCRLSALYLADHRLDDACRLVMSVYRNPAQSDLGPLLDYLAASGQLKVDAAGTLPAGEVPLTFVHRAQLLAAEYERLTGTGRWDEALRLVCAHPELLPVVPALVVKLREKASPDQMRVLTKLLEAAVNSAETPSDFVRTELAKLYVRQAEFLATGQAARVDGTLNLLTQAYELSPDDFAVARPLAAAFHAEHQEARAKTVLAPFVEAGALPTEQAAARLVLEAR